SRTWRRRARQRTRTRWRSRTRKRSLTGNLSPLRKTRRVFSCGKRNCFLFIEKGFILTAEVDGMKRPLWVMAVGWACGIGIEAAWKCSSLLWAVGGVLVLLIGGVIYLRRLQGLVMTLFWSALFFGATQFSMVDEGNQSTLPFSSTTDSYQARVTGTVASTPVVDGDRVKMELETRGIDDGQGLQRVKERVMVQLRLGSAEEKQAASTLRRGIKLRLPMTWTRPDPARNPGA